MVNEFCKENSNIVVGFDVDGTLIDLLSRPRYDVISAFKFFKSINCKMIIWSGGGLDYARNWARKLGLDATIINKGSMKVDIAFDDEDVELGEINIKV